MQKKIINTLLLLIVSIGFSCCNNYIPEKVFFEKYEIANGHYKLLFFGTEGVWVDDFRNFY